MVQEQQKVFNCVMDRLSLCSQQKHYQIWAMLKLDVTQIISSIFQNSCAVHMSEEYNNDADRSNFNSKVHTRFHSGRRNHAGLQRKTASDAIAFNGKHSQPLRSSAEQDTTNRSLSAVQTSERKFLQNGNNEMVKY